MPRLRITIEASQVDAENAWMLDNLHAPDTFSADCLTCEGVIEDERLVALLRERYPDLEEVEPR
jgi:hypothetical protein